MSIIDLSGATDLSLGTIAYHEGDYWSAGLHYVFAVPIGGSVLKAGTLAAKAAIKGAKTAAKPVVKTVGQASTTLVQKARAIRTPKRIANSAKKAELDGDGVKDLAELGSKVKSVGITDDFAKSLKTARDVDPSVKARSLQRVSEFGSSWKSANIDDSIKKFSEPNPKVSGTDTGIEVVHDFHGKYFRVIDPSVSGRRKALDLSGSIPNNKTLPDGRQVGRTKAEYEEVTHFKID